MTDHACAVSTLQPFSNPRAVVAGGCRRRAQWGACVVVRGGAPRHALVDALLHGDSLAVIACLSRGAATERAELPCTLHQFATMGKGSSRQGRIAFPAELPWARTSLNAVTDLVAILPCTSQPRTRLSQPLTSPLQSNQLAQAAITRLAMLVGSRTFESSGMEAYHGFINMPAMGRWLAACASVHGNSSKRPDPQHKLLRLQRTWRTRLDLHF